LASEKRPTVDGIGDGVLKLINHALLRHRYSDNKLQM
jgi:hypothetical protein